MYGSIPEVICDAWKCYQGYVMSMKKIDPEIVKLTSGVMIYCDKPIRDSVRADFISIFTDIWNDLEKRTEIEYGECDFIKDRISVYDADDGVIIQVNTLMIDEGYGPLWYNEQPYYGDAALKQALEEVRKKYPGIEYDGAITYHVSDHNTDSYENSYMISSYGEDGKKVCAYLGNAFKRMLNGDDNGLGRTSKDDEYTAFEGCLEEIGALEGGCFEEIIGFYNDCYLYLGEELYTKAVERLFRFFCENCCGNNEECEIKESKKSINTCPNEEFISVKQLIKQRNKKVSNEKPYEVEKIFEEISSVKKTPKSQVSHKRRKVEELKTKTQEDGTLKLLKYSGRKACVILENNITEIGGGAFDHNLTIKELTVSENLRKIGVLAFSGCKNLRIINGLSPDVKIDSKAFYACDKLTDKDGFITINGKVFDYGYEEAGDWYKNIKRLSMDLSDERIDIRRYKIMPRIVYHREYEKQDSSISKLKLSEIKKNDIVTFGRFPIDTSYKFKPLEWKVLAVEKNRALLLTKEVIMADQDGMVYDVLRSWKTSYYKRLLNKDFYNIAFDDEEKVRIVLKRNKIPPMNGLTEDIDGETSVDKVFLLSKEELEQYIPEKKERKTELTKYALFQSEEERRGEAAWILRSSSRFGFMLVDVEDGSICVHGNRVGRRGIRPAIWVKLLDN